MILDANHWHQDKWRRKIDPKLVMYRANLREDGKAVLAKEGEPFTVWATKDEMEWKGEEAK